MAITLLWKFFFQRIRLIAEQETALMHQRHTMAALGLIEISG